MNTQNGQTAFTKGADILAIAGGIAMAFITTPLLYHAVIGAAYEFTFAQYGEDWIWLVPIVCGLGSAAISFAACQILLSLTLRLGFAKLAQMIFR